MKRLLAGIAIALGVAPAQGALRVEGTASLLDTGVPVYVEEHRIDAVQQQVKYRDPDGRLIASLSLDYRCSDYAPSFEQHDRRAGVRLAGHWTEGTYTLTRSTDAEVARSRTAVLPPDELTLVASSGFERYIQQNWEGLVSGKPSVFRFVMSGRLDTLRLRVKRANRPPDTELTWFMIEPDTGLLRLIAEPILLGYDTGRRLRVYRGLSNLADADGSSLSVQIRYEYAEDESTGISSAEPHRYGQRITPHEDCRAERT